MGTLSVYVPDKLYYKILDYEMKHKGEGVNKSTIVTEALKKWFKDKGIE